MLHECYMLRQARPGMAGCLREDADRPADELAVWLAPQLQEASRAASQLGPTPRNRARAAVEGAKATRLQNHEAGFQCNKQKRRYKKQILQASMQARILASRGRCHSRRLCPLRLCVRGAATSHARTRPPSPATPCPCCHLLSTTARQKPKLSCSILLPREEQNKRLGSQGRALFTMLAVMVRRALRQRLSHKAQPARNTLGEIVAALLSKRCGCAERHLAAVSITFPSNAQVETCQDAWSPPRHQLA